MLYTLNHYISRAEMDISTEKIRIPVAIGNIGKCNTNNYTVKSRRALYIGWSIRAPHIYCKIEHIQVQTESPYLLAKPTFTGQIECPTITSQEEALISNDQINLKVSDIYWSRSFKLF